MLVYKVVRRRRDNRRVSAIISENGLTEYHIGKIIKRKKSKDGKLFGPLCCFGSYEQANRFYVTFATCSPEEIWEAEAEQSVDRSGIWIMYKGRKRVCNFFQRKSKSSNRVSLPEGTILCDSVKLLRRIK